MQNLIPALLLTFMTAAPTFAAAQSEQASGYLNLQCELVVEASGAVARSPLAVVHDDDVHQVLRYKNETVIANVSQYAGDDGYIDLSIITKTVTASAGSFVGPRGDLPRLHLKSANSKDRTYINCQVRK